jgi:hypothetical protein
MVSNALGGSMTISLPIKLKFDKKFQPVSSDDGDELYPNGIFVFNISKLLIFIKENPHLFQPESVSVKSARTFPSSNLSESTIQTANTSEPIILAEIAPGKFNVIDGNHRLERAYRDGMIDILAYKVKVEHHIRFLTSIKAYKVCIDYWNAKIAHYHS